MPRALVTAFQRLHASRARSRTTVSSSPALLSAPSYDARPHTHLRRSRPTLSGLTWTTRFADNSTQYDRSPPVAERVADPSCCRFHTTSRAGRTLPVPDANPANEAELILTLPPPPLHTTH
ncbi:hypothetical protein B0H14DRAFT_3445573 [Mycena olivaceomarginata]|nr:hypothetical protein B0H14DRAFT_3445573 [Mycena olivaceomarginata]